MSSEYLLLPKRSEAEVREEHLAIRRHQIRRQVELEQKADFYDRLSITATDPVVRAEALQMAVEFAARANRIRTAVALTNWMVPQGADEQSRAEDDRDKPHRVAVWS